MKVAAARGPCSLDEAGEILARGLTRARGEYALVTVPAPVAPLASIWSAWPGGGTALHASPAGPALVGLGLAAEYRGRSLRPKGPLAWLRDLRLPQARFLAGAAFSPASVGQGPWIGFPTLRLLLPRWLYTLEGRRASWTLAISTGDLGEVSRRRAREELAALWSALPKPPARPEAAVPRQLSPRRWRSFVEPALAAIASGRLEKLVPARCARVEAAEDWDAAALLEALARDPGSTLFAFREGEATFLGATPERLVARVGRCVFTEALAGTVRRGNPVVELRSAKMAREHGLVVSEILRRLRPFCGKLEGRAPAPRPLADMIHLRTPVEGRLRSDRHVLELALALHPTPAVSGLPTAAAVRWLQAHEPEPRGWYAGFVGWCDGRGDGELSVAIRSGLLRGREARLYTGAGLVAGSTPAAEYQETALKQRPFLRALGALP